MSFEHIILSQESGIGIIKINRPELRNAINAQTLSEIEMALDCFEQDESVFVIVFTGEGDKSFAAGADIRQLRDRKAVEMLLPGMSGTYRKIEQSSKATIAAINGYALGGGCELALACDIRMAVEHAKLGLPELNLSIIPGAGGTQRLARIIGKGLALDMILTGEIITADRAKEMGLVSHVSPKEHLWQAVMDKAEKIQAKGPLAVKMAKLVVNKGYDLDMDSALQMEKLAQAFLYHTEDKYEGAQAFLDKRKPQFKGK